MGAKLRASLAWSISPLLVGGALAATAPTANQKHEDFLAAPPWESYRSRLLPEPRPRTRQDFGYRTSNHAGGQKTGEIGGWVQRSMSPAWLARIITPKSLNDRLQASGKFAVTEDGGASGVLFGWFHESSRGWRTPNSLAFRIDGNGGKYWIFFEYGTRHWLTGGEGTFEGPRYQTTKTKPFPADGTTHAWSLTYDPTGADGNGLITFELDGNPYRCELAPGHKADGAEFNRFGMFNLQLSGGGMKVYFDDLQIDGETESFDNAPNWEARGNEVEFSERAIRPWHDFGHSQTRYAGGQPGEVGGIIWRDEAPAYYADRVGPFTLQEELSASGKLVLTGAGSDSGVYLGWFNSISKKNKTTPEYQESQKNLLAILIEGPSRVGHYFRPGYRTGSGAGVTADTGPVIRPDGTVHEWSIRYSPSGAGGRGQITVHFDAQVQTLDLQPGHKSLSTSFDRFGLFNLQAGGHHVEIYVDDLSYTARPK